MQAELARIGDEQERLAWFREAVRDFDKADALNERKHWRVERRHEFDPHLLDQDVDEEVGVPAVFRTLNSSEGWLDSIFSRRPEDLHELAEDGAMSRALRGLKSSRKEVLFYRVVHGYSTREVAASSGVSERFARKLYARATAEVRAAMEEVAGAYNN